MKNFCLFLSILFLTAPVVAKSICDGLTPTIRVTSDSTGDRDSVWGTTRDDVILIENMKGDVNIFLTGDANSFPAGKGAGGSDIICFSGASNSARIFLWPDRLFSYSLIGENVGNVSVSSSGYFPDTRNKVNLKNINNVHIYSTSGAHNIEVEASQFGFIVLGKGDDSVTVKTNSRNSWGFFVNGGAGNDYIRGSSAADILVGGDGSDQIWGNGGEDLLFGSSAYQTVGTSSSYQFMATWHQYKAKDFYDFGFIERDSTDAAGGGIYGGDGDDVIIGSDGQEYLEGGYGYDYIEGHKGNDGIYLFERKDIGETYKWKLRDKSESGSFAIMTAGDDDGGYIDGGDGNDEIWGSNGEDTLIGGKGNDKIYSMAGNDKIDIGRCNDLDYGFGMGGNTSWIFCTGDYVIHTKDTGYKVK